MKKIINEVEDIVLEMCRGLATAHPELTLHESSKVFTRKSAPKKKVTLISGGGSGHEPAHAGFVGTGMLDAAVCGDVFASPSQIQVYKGIKEVASEKGSLLIVKNYSGDLMNFSNAMHLAEEDGIKVDYIKVDDDIAVEDSLYTVGRRGVAGTMLVHKIAGGAAERGDSLEEVKRVAEKAASFVKSIGFAFTSCTVPAKGTPTFKLQEDEIEYGVGIHGEPGIKRDKIATADELSERMVSALLEELKPEGEVVVLVNGFGGTPLIELYLLANSVDNYLAKENITTYKTLVGNYMTSLDMAGASISIMKMDDELKELFSAPCETPAFVVNNFVMDSPRKERREKKVNHNDFSNHIFGDYRAIESEVITLENIQYMVDTMSNSVIKNEILFCELDSYAGDGDFGMSLAKGFKQLKREWSRLTQEENQSIESFLDACAFIIMEHCGGASGPIWGSGFRGAAKSAKDKNELNLQDFADMLYASVESIQAIGERSFGRGAVVGDKTLIDALIPAANSLKESAKKGDTILEAMCKSAQAAQKGAKATEDIVARMGRAGTAGERSLGYPDAGAHGLAVIFTDVVESMKKA